MFKMLSLLIVLTALSVHATQRECLRVNYVSVLDSGENSQMYFNYIYSKVQVYDANGNIVDKIQGWRRSERNGVFEFDSVDTKNATRNDTKVNNVELNDEEKKEAFYFKYFNDPKEINAMINEVVAVARKDSNFRDKVKNSEPQEFYNLAFKIMRHSEEDIRYFAEEGALRHFYEGLSTIRAKIIQGYYDHR